MRLLIVCSLVIALEGCAGSLVHMKLATIGEPPPEVSVEWIKQERQSCALNAQKQMGEPGEQVERTPLMYVGGIIDILLGLPMYAVDEQVYRNCLKSKGFTALD